jgi:hypothetical protein
MISWRQSSIFMKYLDELRSSASRPLVIDWQSDASIAEDLTLLTKMSFALAKVQNMVENRAAEETQVLRQITSVIQRLRNKPYARPAEASIPVMAELRSMTFWQPLHILKRAPVDWTTLILLAHIHAVALLMQPVLSVKGGLYFPIISMTPIENIYRKLLKLNFEWNDDVAGLTLPLELMEYPLEIVAHFRRRRSIEMCSQSSKVQDLSS